MDLITIARNITKKKRKMCLIEESSNVWIWGWTVERKEGKEKEHEHPCSDVKKRASNQKE
jgi:hypothetical protein